MKDLIKKFMDLLVGDKPSTGMTFVRQFGKATKPGHQIVGFLTLLAVPDDEAVLISYEWHSPTMGACKYAKDAVVLIISTGEGKDVSELSRGDGFDGIVREPIWRF